MSSIMDQLLEMGFSSLKAEKAINLSGNISLEAAMNWIVDHENDYDDENAQETGSLGDKQNMDTISKSFCCEDCNKSLRNDEEVHLHSARTGHLNYAESSEEVKLLTDEEKKQQMEKLKELLKLKQSQRDEQKRQAEICQEKQRRTQGKYMGSAKAKFDEDEIRRMLEQKKREKDEDKAYREKLKADIAREREEKRIRRLDEVDIPKSSPIPPMVSFAKSDNTTCRLQIRFPSGILVKSEFKAEDLLEKVMLYVTENWPDSLGLIQSNQIQVFTNFPKREFLETDLNVSLFDLGLCPSAVLFARELPSTV